MTDYPNWFNVTAVRFFEKHLSPLAGRPDLRFLQIGAFTGDASVWMLENVLTDPSSLLVDVDTWEGSAEPEHEPFAWTDVELQYRAKVSPWMRMWEGDPIRGGSVTPIQAPSRSFFSVETFRRVQSGKRRLFDFVYIDGDHTPYGVLNDAVDAFRALKPGGLIAFDDYQWVDSRTHVGPGPTIDAFADAYKGRLQLIQLGPQAWFRKTDATERAVWAS